MVIVVCSCISLFLILLGMRAQHAELKSKAELYTWQCRQLRFLGAGVSRDPLYRELVGEGGWRREGASKLVTQLLQYVKERTRCNSAYIHLELNSEIFAGEFNLLSDRARRLIVSSFESERAPESGMSQFGFSSTVLRCAKTDSGVRGGVWLGYSDRIGSTQIEEELAAELIELAIDELRYVATLNSIERPIQMGSGDKGEVLVQFSHDIRSPLNNVKSILALLKLEDLRAESAELVDVALSNCRGVEAIVEDVIDLARHRAGKLNRKADFVNLKALVEEVVAGFQVAAKMKGLALEFNPAEDEAYTSGDQNQLRRIVTNLVSNALKYTTYGVVAVALEKGSNESVSIVVRDTGVGMDRDQLEKLFVPFTRFDAVAAGVGLGLSITKTLTELHGGEIAVTSEIGRGSEFVVRLPCGERGTEGAGAALSVRTESLKADRILVVDDDADLVRSTAKLLVRDGYVVAQACTVHDALSILNFRGADIVITDAAMPGGGGREILRFVHEKGLNVPVIVISGDSDSAKTLRAFGAAVVLEKPCEYATLKQSIEGLRDSLPNSDLSEDVVGTCLNR